MDSAAAKREFAIALLEESSIFVHLDPRKEGVVVPGWLKKQPQLVLQIGLNMAVRIPDLDIGEEAICCTLSFNRSPFFCGVPWSAVFGLVGEDGRGRIWPEDVPIEIAAQMQQQAASKEQPKDAAKPQKQAGKAKLQAVSSGPAKAEAAKSDVPRGVDKAPNPEPAAPQPQPSASKSVRPSAAPGAKRELPSYLRVVK